MCCRKTEVKNNNSSCQDDIKYGTFDWERSDESQSKLIKSNKINKQLNHKLNKAKLIKNHNNIFDE